MWQGWAKKFPWWDCMCWLLNKCQRDQILQKVHRISQQWQRKQLVSLLLWKYFCFHCDSWSYCKHPPSPETSQTQDHFNSWQNHKLRYKQSRREFTCSSLSLYFSENSSPPIFRLDRNCSRDFSLMRKCSESRCAVLRYGLDPPHTDSINWEYISFASATADKLLASAVACGKQFK